MYLKVMPRSYKGHKYILCIIDEVTNYLIMVPIYQARSEEIGEALIESVITNVKVQNMMLCISMMYGIYACSPMLIPRQLRFSLYSRAVITGGRCSLFTSLLWFLS